MSIGTKQQQQPTTDNDAAAGDSWHLAGGRTLVGHPRAAEAAAAWEIERKEPIIFC